MAAAYALRCAPGLPAACGGVPIPAALQDARQDYAHPRRTPFMAAAYALRCAPGLPAACGGVPIPAALQDARPDYAHPRRTLSA
jgi:hypothetical protein